MKITYNEIKLANEPLYQLSKEKVSVKEAVGIARIIKSIRDEVAICQEKEREIVEKYGTVDEKGNYKFADEVISDLNREFGELIGYEVDIDITPVKLSSDIKIDANTVMILEKFIDFE